jgi:hypothetical protein
LADLKGGELLNSMSAPTSTPPAKKLAGSSMSCPIVQRTVTDLGARGAFSHVTAYSAHACGSCGVKETKAGAGKSATYQVEHSCKQADTCCKGH